MASQDARVQILTRLGLTLSQARIYFALVESGTSTAKTISKVSGVAREHVYETMLQLQDLGLVEKEITVPSKFRCMPIQEALSILLERRIKETSELEAKTRELLHNFEKYNVKMTLQKEEENQFVLVPEKEALILRAKKAIMTAQRSIDIIITWKKFPQVLLLIAKTLEKAMKRGVKI